jgi:hypothetical protein
MECCLVWDPPLLRWQASDALVFAYSDHRGEWENAFNPGTFRAAAVPPLPSLFAAHCIHEGPYPLWNTTQSPVQQAPDLLVINMSFSFMVRNPE